MRNHFLSALSKAGLEIGKDVVNDLCLENRDLHINKEVYQHLMMPESFVSSDVTSGEALRDFRSLHVRH